MSQSMSVEAVLSAYDESFSATLDKALKSIQNLNTSTSSAAKSVNSSGSNISDTFKAMAGAMGVMQIASGAFNLIKGSVGGAVKRLDTLNNATRTFSNMNFSTSQIQSAMNGLKESVKGLPTPLDQSVKGVQMIAAATGNLGKSQKVYSALNDSIIGFGGSTADVNNAVIQLSQAFANGKVDGMTWLSMMNSNMGSVLNAMAKKMGITTGQLKDGLSSGKISVKQFQDALIDLDKNGGGGLKSLHKIAKDSTDGIETSFMNMKTAVARGITSAIQAMNELSEALTGSSIADIISNIGSAFESAMKMVANILKAITPAVQQFSKAIKDLGLGSVFSSLAAGLGTFIGMVSGLVGTILIINQVKKAFALFNMVLSANPFIIIVSAIAAVVAALTYFFTQTKLGKSLWSGFVNWLQSAWHSLVGVATTVWNGISNAITTCVNIVKSAWQGIVEFFTTLWTGIVNIATTIWNMLVTVVQTVVIAIQTAWQGFTTFLTTLWTGIVTIATTIWTMLVTVITTVVTAIQAVWSGFSGFMSGVWSGIVSVASAVWESLVSVISAVWSTITSVVSGAVSAVGSVVSAGFNAARAIVSSVMNAMQAVISSVWNGIKSLFSAGVNFIKSVVHIDLSAEGRAIMNSFFEGLKSVWNSIKSFVSGIAGWIKAHKGPISYDRKLLIPAGQAIMNGLNNGLINGFGEVQSNVSDMANQIQQAITTPGFDIGASIGNLGSINSNYTGSLAIQDSQLQMQNNALLRQLLNKDTTMVLDDGTLVGYTADQYDYRLGQNTALKERWSR